MHSTLSHVLCFIISLVLWAFWWLCKLVRSYLSNQKSHGLLPGILSPPFEILSGVPQGSVLRPLLFSMLLNDLRDPVAHSKDPLLLTISKDSCMNSDISKIEVISSRGTIYKPIINFANAP
jgi:hypothetical protein